MSETRPGALLSALVNPEGLSFIGLQAAEEASRTWKEFQAVKNIADTVIQLVELAKETNKVDQSCDLLVEKTLTTSNGFFESCKQISRSDRRGKMIENLTIELESYCQLLEEIMVEIQKRCSIHWLGNIMRDRKSLIEYQRRLENVDRNLILRLKEYGPQISCGPPTITTGNAQPPEQPIHHTPKTVGPSNQDQGGLFQNARNTYIHDGHFNNVRGNMTINIQKFARPSITTYAHMLPPKPRYVFEREKEFKQIVSTLVDAEHGRVAILGGGGMGKTTLAVSAMHDKRVIARYGKQRLYVFCEGIISPNLVWPEIAKSLGIPTEDHGEDLPSVVLDKLHGHSTLLCLDNFETLWEPIEHRPQAEELLSHLDSVDTLSLLITMRGTQQPAQSSGIWSKPLLPPLESLSRLGAQKIMDAVADVRPGDDYVNKLLAEVEGVPLAITILAYLLQEGNETPGSLWKRWDKERTRMLDTGGRNRLSTVDISIQMSIDSDRMQNDPNAINLLAIFSLLPSGFPESDESLDGLQTLLPETFNLRQSILTLRRVALMSSIDSSTHHRLRILPPIRHYCQAYLNADHSHKTALVEFYVNLIIENEDYSDPLLHRKIPQELSNVQWVLLSTYCNISTSQMAEASVSFTDWSSYVGVPSTDVIRRATEMCIESPKDVGNCFRSLGDLYFHRGQLEDAETAFNRAVDLHREVRDVLGEANGLHQLGELYLRRHQLEDAETAFNHAVDLHREAQDVFGEANDVQKLGELYLRRHQLEDAEKAFNRAVKLHQEAQDVLGEANGLRKLGELYSRRGQLEDAETAFDRAVDLHREAQDVLGEANGLYKLGELYLRRHQLEDAETAFNRAVDLHRQAHSVLGEAYDIQKLGELYLRRHQLEDAETAFDRAIDLHREAQDVLGEAYDVQNLGKLYLRRHQLGDAEKAFNRAVDLHRQAHSVLGEAYDVQNLGEVYLRRHQLEDAEKAFNRAVGLHREAQDVLGEANDLRKLGELYFRRDQLDDAETAFNRAVDLHREAQDVLGEANDLRKLGELYLRRHQLEDAETALNRAADLHTRTGDILGLSGDLCFMAKLYLSLDNLQLAEDTCMRAIEVSQKAQSAYNRQIASSVLKDIHRRRIASK